MVTGTVTGPEVTTWVSLSYVQCFLYLASSSINVSIFILYVWICSGQTSYVWGQAGNWKSLRGTLCEVYDCLNHYAVRMKQP